MRPLIAAGLWLAACCPAFAADIIGKAGANEIDALQVRALVAALPDATRDVVTRDLRALEQVVRADLASRAVLADAKAAGFERRPETQVELNRMRDEALARLWLISKAQAPAGYPTDAELTEAYSQNKAALQSSPEYRLAQIFIAAPDSAEPNKLAQALRKIMDLAPRLAGSADFGKLARENTEQADAAAKDGELGWLAEAQLLPEVRAAVRSLKVGEIAGPLKTSQGFHFIKLVELKPARQLSMAEARETLVAALRARRGQELQQQYVAGLGDKLAVTINQIGLANLQSSLRQP